MCRGEPVGLLCPGARERRRFPLPGTRPSPLQWTGLSSKVRRRFGNRLDGDMRLDEMRWMATDFHEERKWKVALAEYEKYLTLYEDSEAAPYSQLKWSLCQRQLRKLNTAIKEGFQSVLDYWPESPEATASMYYIGQTYKNMGEIRRAKKAYKEVLTTYPDHVVSVYAINDLIAIATT